MIDEGRLVQIAAGHKEANESEGRKMANELRAARLVCRAAADLERAWARDDITIDNIDDDFMTDMGAAIVRWKREAGR